MTRYRFTRAYHSSIVTAMEGDEHEFDDATADHLERDSPGVLAPVVVKAEPEVEERAVETPPADRMQRKPAAKRGAG